MQDQVSLFLRGGVFFSVAFGVFQIIKYMKEQRSPKVDEVVGNEESFDIMKDKTFINAMYSISFDFFLWLIVCFPQTPIQGSGTKSSHFIHQ